MFTDIIQPTHLLFILVVALIVLGPKRLPEVGKSLGKGLRDFRGAMSGVEDHTHNLLNPDDAHSATEDPIPAATAMHAPEPEAVHGNEHEHTAISPPDVPTTPADISAVEATAPAAPSPTHQD